MQTLQTLSKQLHTPLNGIFTTDFKEDMNGYPKITEINIRHVAFTSSLAAGGANLPLRTLQAMFFDLPENTQTIHYRFPEKYIFLRDVDSYPILMKETDLLKSN
ncbi:MAG: hypothetical protein JST63_19570 [Bacteroidetes bacterium]|nr:hypothetical protein [Bacteroidota bacterium]